MQLTMIQFRRADQQHCMDVCAVKNAGIANKYTQYLKNKYPFYQNGEFIIKKVKFIRSINEAHMD